MTNKLIRIALPLVIGLLLAAASAARASNYPMMHPDPADECGPPHCFTGSHSGPSGGGCGTGGKPAEVIDTYKGTLTVMDMPVHYRSVGDAVPFVIYFNSTDWSWGNTSKQPLNVSWTHTYNVYIFSNLPYGVWVREGNGQVHWFAKNATGDGYTSPKGVFDTLRNDTPSGWVLTRPDQHKLYFRSDCRLAKIKDKNDLTWTLTYTTVSPYFRLASITDPVGRQTTFDYTYYASSVGKYLLTRVTVPGGLHADFTYDLSVQTARGPATITDAAGDTYALTYGPGTSDCLVTSVTDPSGRRVDYTYNTQLGNTRMLGATSIEGLSNSTVTYTYTFHHFTDHDERWTDIEEFKDAPSYRITRHMHDYTHGGSTQYGRLLKVITDPGNSPHLNATQSWEYDSLLRMTQHRDSSQTETGGKEHRDWYFYEDTANLGRVTRYVDAQNYNAGEPPPTGWDGSNCPSYQFQYDALGNLTEVATPEGRTTDFAYESGTDRVSTATVHDTDKDGNPYDHTTSFTYDSSHGYQLSTVTDAGDNATSFSYDDTYWYLNQIDPPQGGDWAFATNEVGDVTSVTDGNGNATGYQYDALHRVTQITYPDVGAGQKIKELSWQCCGLESLTDENGVETKYDYNQYTHRLSQVHEDYMGLNYVTQYGYDEVGNLKTVTNARGKTTTYTYDAASRLTRADYPDSTYETWSYRDDGRVYSHTDARGRTTYYRYDADDRLWGPAGSGYVAIDYPNDTDVNITRDQDGLITSLTDASGATDLAYYPSQWVKSVTDGAGKTVSYDYNDVGEVSSLNLPEGGSFAYTYNALNLLDSVTTPSGAAMSVDYDDGGRCTRITRPGSYIDYQYNARNWLTEVLNRTTVGDTIFDNSYGYQAGSVWDHTGNPLWRSEFVDNTTYTTSYSYDALYRLTEETRSPGDYDTGYTYDHVGNRLTRDLDGTTVTYTYDDNDKLTSADDGSSFGYDANGNMTSVSGPLGSWTLAYSDANRLTSVTYPTGTDSFTYNALGQRMRANLNGSVLRYIYSGDRVVEQTDDEGNMLTRYGLAGGSYYDPLLGFESADGDQRYPLSDLIGTARRLVDESGAATDAYSLDAFGRYMDGWTNQTPNPYRFGGAWGYTTDTPGSALLQLGARFYWPEVGRFIQQDPIGDGVNWYAYVGNNPVTEIDPEGLWRKEWHKATTICQAEGAGFGADAAAAIGQAAYDIDNKWSLGSLPHFDIRVPLLGTLESKRDFAGMEAALAASYYRRGRTQDAYLHLGRAVHAIQDDYAHGNIYWWQHHDWMDEPNDPRRCQQASAAAWETGNFLANWLQRYGARR